MAKFCKHCGTQLDGDSKFCEQCGAVLASPAAPYQQPRPVMTYNPNLIGFSQKIHDPIFEQRQKDLTNRSIKHGLFFFPIVMLAFQIPPFFSDDFTRPIALIVGCIVGGFGLVMTLFGSAKRAVAKTWDGVVVDKKITRHRNNEDERERYGAGFYHYHHKIIFKTTEGKRRQIEREFDYDDADAWDMMIYLNIGDKVRYHGRLNYFEKYDKSRDAQVPCAHCKEYADIRLDNCPKCKAPIIKP